MRYRPRNMRRFNTSSEGVKALQAGFRNLIVDTDDRIFMSFDVGWEAKVSGHRGGTCRCRIIDIRRYQTLEEIAEEEDPHRIAYRTTRELEPDHVYVVIELALIEHPAAVAAIKQGA